MNIKELRSVIMTASHDELNEIVSMVKLRRSHLKARRRRRRSRSPTGKVTKINRKTVKVMSDRSVLWTVTPSILEAV